MRVLHTIADLSSVKGGPSRSVPQLCNAIGQLGHEVGVWTSAPWHGYPGHDGYQIFAGPLRHVLTTFRPDIVHDHGLWMSSNARSAMLSRAMSIPYVNSPRGMLMPWSLSRSRWKKQVVWYAYQRAAIMGATALHATAPEEADELRRLGYRGGIIIAPNGVDAPGVPSVEKSQKGRNKQALFLSRIHPKKGLPMLMDAWARLRPPGWRMLVVGPSDDSYLGGLRRRINELSLCDAWEFRPEVGEAEKWRLMHQSDLFILPSYSENFGIVVAEALAAGLPVITTKGTPWGGLVEKGCGWWVETEVESLASALVEAVALTDDERSQMGEAGVQWVRSAFSWPAIARRIVEGYGEIL